MPLLTLQSPAKINLSLRILNRREDGYHNISSLMEKVTLFDALTLEKIPSGIELVFGPRSSVFGPIEENLCFKAAQLIHRKVHEVSGSSCGVRIQLSKKIPMGAGLGGGSSNAATVLKGLNQLWGLNWPLEKLAALGVRLGADVPFFIYDGPAQIEGIGDKMTSLTKLPNLSIILINPGVHVSTPWAYAAWDRRSQAPLGPLPQREPGTFCGNPLTPQNRSVTSARTFREIAQELHNDFEAVVIPEHPEIQSAKEALKNVGSPGVLMSGSGSTIFGLFETKALRDRALDKIEKREKWQVFAVENWGVDKR